LGGGLTALGGGPYRLGVEGGQLLLHDPRLVPDLILPEDEDDEAVLLVPADAVLVVESIEEHPVMATRHDLDQGEGEITKDEIHPSIPRDASDVDLTPEADPDLAGQLLGPAFSPAAGGLLVGRALVKQDADQRNPVTPSLSQLGEEVMQRPIRTEAHGCHVVEGSFGTTGADRSGEEEDGESRRGHRHSSEAGEVFSGQGPVEVDHGQTGSDPGALMGNRDVDPTIEVETRYPPPGRRRSVR